MTFFSNMIVQNRDGTERLSTVHNVFWYKYLYTSIFSSTGCHVGHSVWNTVREASWMIYGYKWDLVIINLVLTISSVKALFSAVSLCVYRNRPFWFVTQDKSFYRYSRYAALKCGEFSSTLFWIRGMASNFGEVCTNFFLRKPKYVFMRKDFLYDLNYADWFFTRLCIPGGMLLSSIYTGEFIAKDAFTGFIGCFGVLDTNASSRYCIYPLPSNDDSIDWIVFINDIVSEFILYKKLWSVLKWYYFILKKPLKFGFFEKWVSMSLNRSLVFDKKLFSKKVGMYSLYFFPLWFISSFNNKFKPIINKLIVNLSNFDVKISKNVLKHIFIDISIKRKLLLLSETVVFLGRPLYFMQDGYSKFLDEVNWQMHIPYKFRFIFYGTVVKKKWYSSFLRKFQRNIIKVKNIGYIKNISFFLSFKIRFVYQRFGLIFGNSFFSKRYRFENIFIFRRWFWLVTRWFFHLGLRKRLRKKFKSFKFFPSPLKFQSFFFFDPLTYNFTNSFLYLHSDYSYFFNKNSSSSFLRIRNISSKGWSFVFNKTQHYI